MNVLAFQTPGALFADYTSRFSDILKGFDWAPVEKLAHELAARRPVAKYVHAAGVGRDHAADRRDVARAEIDAVLPARVGCVPLQFMPGTVAGFRHSTSRQTTSVVPAIWVLHCP